MEQLTGVDTGFLNMETSTTYGHVASMLVFDRSGSAGTDLFAALKRTFEERLHLLGVYRRRLVEVPFGLDHPYWIDDPDFDLEFHLRESAVPAPGSDFQLAEHVARIVSRPLDRSRPLWEYYVISGLEGDRIAMLMKMHHATIDGISGALLLNILLDTEREGRLVEPPAIPWRGERLPSGGELLARTWIAYALRPKKALELQVRLVRAAAQLVGSANSQEMMADLTQPPGADDQDDQLHALLAGPAPRTSFNRTITGHRRFAFRTLALTDAQAIKRAFGATVNDVVMAICAGALRRYLSDHNALPDAPLLAMVPVSVRTAAEGGKYTNQVTGVRSSLHTQLADPVERLRAIHSSMAAAKDMQQAIPANVLSDMAQFTPPALAGQAARLVSRLRVADRLNPPFNVLISNVPGPKAPLYLAGAAMEHFYPVSTVMDGVGLNMTVQSYMNNLDFGLIACRELVPDLWDLCDHLADSMDELLVAAGKEV